MSLSFQFCYSFSVFLNSCLRYCSSPSLIDDSKTPQPKRVLLLLPASQNSYHSIMHHSLHTFYFTIMWAELPTFQLPADSGLPPLPVLHLLSAVIRFVPLLFQLPRTASLSLAIASLATYGSFPRSFFFLADPSLFLHFCFPSSSSFLIRNCVAEHLLRRQKHFSRHRAVSYFAIMKDALIVNSMQPCLSFSLSTISRLRLLSSALYRGLHTLPWNGLCQIPSFFSFSSSCLWLVHNDTSSNQNSCILIVHFPSGLSMCRSFFNLHYNFRRTLARAVYSTNPFSRAIRV